MELEPKADGRRSTPWVLFEAKLARLQKYGKYGFFLIGFTVFLLFLFDFLDELEGADLNFKLHWR